MIYHEDYVISMFHGDQNGRVSLSTMLNAMLMVSEHQLDQHEAGVYKLAELGAGWVITQYHMIIDEIPRVETILKVGTQATTYNKYLTYRDYWIDDATGKRMVTIHSTWVMMDLATRKIQTVIPDIVERVGATFDRQVQRFPRIKKITTADGEVPYRVRYFDIDGNGHVNNAHYLDWMEDSLGYEWLRAHTLTQADIRYEREVAYGTTPLARFQYDPEDQNRTLHQVVSHDEVNAEAMFTWKSATNAG